jgi:potassium-dependent mechanosensitive channel
MDAKFKTLLWKLFPILLFQTVVQLQLLFAGSAARADESAITKESITTQLKEAEKLEAESPDRAKITEALNEALDYLKQADGKRARIAELEAKRVAVPSQLELRKRDAAAGHKQPALPPNVALADWEQSLDTAEQELSVAQKALETNEEEVQRHASRRREIPEAIAEARIKLDELGPASAELSGAAEETPAVADAWLARREAQRKLLHADVELLEKEMQTYDSTAMELSNLERDAAAQAVDEIEKRLADWRDAINARRRLEVEKQALEAHWAAATSDPAIRKLADENTALADRRRDVTKQIEEFAGQQTTVQEHLEKVRAQRKQATDKMKLAGLTEAIGQMLLMQRTELLAIEADRREVTARKREISRIQLELFDLNEQSTSLRDLDARIKEITASLSADGKAKPDDLRSLLKTRRKYVNSLMTDIDSYFNDLVELDSKQRELLSVADSYRNFIDERVLWVRSTHPITVADTPRAAEAAGWVASPTHWHETAGALVDEIRASPLSCSLIALAWCFALAMQGRLRNSIQRWAAPNRPLQSTAISSLRRALSTTAATLILAALWPSLLWLLGTWIANGAATRGEFASAIGAALKLTAEIMFPLLFARQICRKDGLAEAHFGWPAAALADLRRQLGWLTALGTPVVLVVAMFESQPNDVWRNSLGRFLFIACQLLLCPFFYRTLKPRTGSLRRLMAMRKGSWTAKLSSSAFFALIAVPPALSLLAAAGYYYTALRLACRLEATIWLILSLVVIQAMAARWLTTIYRRLAIEAAVRGIEAAQEPSQSVSLALASAGGAPQPTEDNNNSAPDIDLEKIDLQTHRLLHSTAILASVIGLCFVWADIFPALRFFDQIVLWGDVENATAVTPKNLLEAIIVAIMATVAVRNLPGLLEIAILERLPLDNGARYAIIAVVRYVIALTGLFFGGAALGIGWPKLQWLAAAISFGLGFGLQEIFANFISGLIVLFEQPMRIGDTVTVGDVTGVVSRIRMRATTIVDGDRKELIVPNKEFITSRLVNWTLTDSVVRLVIPLGISYGSDTLKVQRLLMQVAAETPTVLSNPPAKAVFLGFGEKLLNFELRVFVGDVDVLMSTRHQLNMAIDRVFRAAGVDIAFPPREPQARALGMQNVVTQVKDKAA